MNIACRLFKSRAAMTEWWCLAACQAVDLHVTAIFAKDSPAPMCHCYSIQISINTTGAAKCFVKRPQQLSSTEKCHIFNKRGNQENMHVFRDANLNL